MTNMGTAVLMDPKHRFPTGALLGGAATIFEACRVFPHLLRFCKRLLYKDSFASLVEN